MIAQSVSTSIKATIERSMCYGCKGKIKNDIIIVTEQDRKMNLGDGLEHINAHYINYILKESISPERSLRI